MTEDLMDHANDRRIVTGAVLSGRGKAAAHIKEDFEEFCTATGQEFLPGSLNIALDQPLFLNAETAISVSEGDRLLWQATLFDQPVWIYRFPHAPLHVVEVLSTEHLRSRFDLEDGQSVPLSIAATDVIDTTLRQRVAWALLWKGRETWSYRRDGYYMRTRRLSIELGATQIRSGKSAIRAVVSFIIRGFK